MNDIGHASRERVTQRPRQIIVVPRHEFFRQCKHVPIHLEQVTDHVVVLKTIEALDGDVQRRRLLARFTQHPFEDGHCIHTVLLVETRFTIGWHRSLIDCLEHPLGQFGIAEKLRQRIQGLKIHVSVGFFIAMAFHAFFHEQWCQSAIEVIRMGADQRVGIGDKG